MANSTIPQLASVTGLTGTELVELAIPTSLPPVTGYTSGKASTQLIGDLAFRRLFPAAMEFIINGQGLPITNKVWGYLTVPFNATISGVRLLGDTAGSITVDIWKCTFAQYDGGVTHPVAGDSICGGSPAQIVASSKGSVSASTLTLWQNQLHQDDILAFDVPSPAVQIGVLTIAIDLTRNSAS